MTDTDQKLREALQVAHKALEAISDDMTVGDRWTNAGQHLLDALDPVRQALALPTAEKELTDEEAMKIINDLGKHDMAVRHLQASGFRWVGDEGKWVQTAAPVGERELPKLPPPYGLFNINGPDGHRISGFTADQMQAYARAALSTGAVVDAQRYRWLREQSDDDFAFAVVKTPHFDVYESPEELDAAIDAAMRKGQL